MNTEDPVINRWGHIVARWYTNRTELIRGLLTLDPATHPDLFGDLSVNRRFLVFVDENVNRLYPGIPPLFDRYGIEAQFVPVPGGEAAKTSAMAERMMAAMDEFGVARFQRVIGIGGGVLHDLLGTAGGLYRRGIPWQFISTTLVAAIDAGFALKSAVNTGWKNRAGLYYPADSSLIDNATFFGTLSAADVFEGYSEMLKWAIAGDHNLFTLLEAHGAQLCEAKFAGVDVITTSCLTSTIEGMLTELYSNPFEEITARRSYLGHALSPGLEPRLTHGRAVAHEICLVTEIAYARGLIAETMRNRIFAAYTNVGMPLWDAALDNPAPLIRALTDTTLHRGQRQEITVPHGQIGEVLYLNDLTTAEIHKGLARLHAYAQSM